MDEYINKAEAIIAGMAVALKGLNTPLKIRARFDEIPAADVVEVVRCKDCKWFVHEGMLCGNNIFIHFDHFYCYYGERKEG